LAAPSRENFLDVHFYRLVSGLGHHRNGKLHLTSPEMRDRFGLQGTVVPQNTDWRLDLQRDVALFFNDKPVSMINMATPIIRRGEGLSGRTKFGGERASPMKARELVGVA